MSDKAITITLTRGEAEIISYGLSDLLCWCSGFAAAHRDDTDDLPMGREAARNLNLKLKSALDAADKGDPAQ